MKHILVTTDFSPESLQAFPAAREQLNNCGHPDCKLTLLAVLEDLAPTSVQFEFALALIDTKEVIEEARKHATQRIRELCDAHFSDLNVEPVVLHASRPVPVEITEYAQEKGVDLIVMATHGRAGIKRLVMGSVAEAVLRNTRCPVMIVPTQTPAQP